MGFCLILCKAEAALRLRTPLLVLALATALVGAAQTAEARERQDLEHLRQSVGEFLQEHYQQPGVADLTIEVGQLDNRLRLAPCEQPLAMTLNDPDLAGGSLTVHTRCPGPTSWALYIPAQIAVFRPVATASRNLGRGHRISESDISLELKNTGRLRQGFVTGTDSLIDMELRRPLRSGEAFRVSALVEPMVVERGDQVRLQVNAGSISVLATGTALGSGRVGEQIRVRNDRSERVVRGRILEKGIVEVTL